MFIILSTGHLWSLYNSDVRAFLLQERMEKDKKVGIFLHGLHYNSVIKQDLSSELLNEMEINYMV